MGGRGQGPGPDVNDRSEDVKGGYDGTISTDDNRGLIIMITAYTLDIRSDRRAWRVALRANAAP